MLIEEATKRGRRYTPDPRPETGGFFRSDHFTFAKAGIPALSLSPGQDLINGKKPANAMTLLPSTLVTRANVKDYKGWSAPR